MSRAKASDYHRFELLVKYWRHLGGALGGVGATVPAKVAYSNCADSLAEAIVTATMERLRENMQPCVTALPEGGAHV